MAPNRISITAIAFAHISFCAVFHATAVWGGAFSDKNQESNISTVTIARLV